MRASYLGRSACLLAALLAGLMLVPPFSSRHWTLRLVASELSIVLIAPVAIAGLLALRLTPGHAILRAFALSALALSFLPFVATLPAYRASGRAFAWSEYFTWGPKHDPVERTTDLVLDPKRPSLRIDLYRGHGIGPRPLVVIVHGGSFSGGDKGENRTESEIFAASGYSVADVQYRLAPAFPFPAAVQDVKCLVGRLRERGAEFGIDPDRVAYLGRSAGGAIAIVAAYSAGDPRIPPSCDVPDHAVSAMVSLYGPLDLEWGWRQRPFPDPIVGYRVLERYIGGTPATHKDAYRLASAVSWVSPAAPPTLLIHGSRDSLVSPHHMELLAQAFAIKNLPPPRQVLAPFADHGFDYHPGGLGEQIVRAETLEFLGRVLGPLSSARN